jgi:hypothetical protein
MAVVTAGAHRFLKKGIEACDGFESYRNEIEGLEYIPAINRAAALLAISPFWPSLDVTLNRRFQVILKILRHAFEPQS